MGNFMIIFLEDTELALLLVKKSVKNTFCLTIKELFKLKYFDDLKPIEEPIVG